MIDKQSEFIEHLFNTISSDPTMPAELKIALLRLQLPIHKLSIEDPHFIANPKHPARYILAITKKISVLAKNHIPTILKTEYILSELLNSSLGVTSFSATNLQLDKLCAALFKKPAQPAHNHQTQLKQLINSTIKQCIHGHDIPAACQDLTLKLWPVALFFILKSYGKNSNQWCESINVYCELLSSIQRIDSKQQHNNLKINFMNIVRKNNKFLMQYNHADTVETAIKYLIAHFNHTLSGSTFSPNTNISDNNSAIKKIASLPPSIKPGVWCEIFIDDITPPRRLRLSVINMDTGMLIFVNRKGIKKLEKDAAEFSVELSRGLSSIYKHDTLFTRPTVKTPLRKIG